MAFLYGCSEDTMDEINHNPNNPTNVSSSLMMTNVIVGTLFNVTDGDYSFYSSVYTEQAVGCHGQMYAAEIRTTQPVSATTYNNTWNGVYGYMYDLKLVMEKCKEGGTEEGNYHTLGIAQILTAYNLATLTDMTGDVPYSEAMQPGVIYQPKLDSQEDLYKEVISLLNAGIDNLSKTEVSYPALGKQDPVYAGNSDLWKKTAYGLLARYTLRLAIANDGLYTNILEYIGNSYKKASEECKLNFDKIGGKNSHYAFLKDRNDLAASGSFHDLMIKHADPRKDMLFRSSNSDPVVFAKNGDPDELGAIQDVFGISALVTKNSPTILLSLDELYFIKAEALARKNSNNEARTELIKAVRAAYGKIAPILNDAFKLPDDDYFNNIGKDKEGAELIKEIMYQKYVAAFEFNSVEAYNDIRRYCAIEKKDIPDYIELKHPHPEKFPVRFTYGNSDVTTNPNVYKAYGSVNVYQDKIWWAQ